MTEEFSWPADNEPSERWPIYTRGNVGEIYPDVVLPLEWDIAGQQSEDGWRAGAKAVGFVLDSDFPADETMTFIGVFGGYAYFNASIMRLLGVRTPGLSVDVIDQQFLGGADVPAYSSAKGHSSLASTARMVRTALRTLLAKKTPLVDQMRERSDALIASRPPLDAPLQDLWNFALAGLAANWEFLIASHVTNSMQAMIASGQLTDLCEAKLGDPNIAVALTTSIGDVRSAGPAQAMWRLANETSSQDFEQAFADFLVDFGHRGPNEFSVVGRDWFGYPEIARDAIDKMRGQGPDRSPDAVSERLRAERNVLLVDARSKLGWQAKRLDAAIANTALWSRAREESKDEVIRAVQPVRLCLREVLRRCAQNGGVSDPMGPLMLSRDEFEQYLVEPSSMVERIAERTAQHQALSERLPPFAFSGTPPTPSTWAMREATAPQSLGVGGSLRGAAGSPGVARGRARVLFDPSDVTMLEPGDILIAPLTDPSWTPLFLAVQAVVVEIGAAMSHSMIVSRELGIPCVVAVEDATVRIADGALIEVDGQAGTVTVLEVP